MDLYEFKTNLVYRASSRTEKLSLRKTKKTDRQTDREKEIQVSTGEI